MSVIFKLSSFCTTKRVRIFSLCCTLLFITCLSAHAALSAGPIVVSANADTNQIRIGEQFKIQLKASSANGTNLSFPLLPDTLNGLEILSRSKVDTSISEDKSTVSYSQSIQVTGFDSGFYVVEPFHFTSLNPENGNLDTFSTEAFLITVKSVPVDTTKAIKDIKAPLSVPLTWKEIILMAAVVLAIILLIVVLIRLWKKRKIKVAPETPKIPARPAHEIALEELRKIEQEKLWQQGFYKKYHSSVSDTLRAYIEHRFEINALELTSDETLERIQRKKMQPLFVEQLSTVLHTADMVKFAKLIPLADENEGAIKSAYNFVNNTRPIVETDLNGKEIAK